MALADTGNAIGAVTRLLRDRLLGLGVADVTVGGPKPLAAANTPRLNLFLYEVAFDGALQNVPLDDGQPAPLWLVLRYLLTAGDTQGESDSIAAHELLGRGTRALQDLNFFSLAGLTADTVAALDDNPDLLKLKFLDANSELVSRLMQGVDEKYRCAVAFEVRPVMVASGQPPAYALLVGINYTANTIVGEDGVVNAVLPSMGPRISGLAPARFETGQSFTLTGDDLHLSGLSVTLGPVELPVTMQRPDRLTAQVPAALEEGATVSAGSHLVTVNQSLPGGRRRGSNPIVAGLLPRLTAAAASGLARVNPPDPASPVTGQLDLTGVLMGRDADDVIVAFLRAGRVAKAFDEFTRPAGPPFQQQMRLDVLPSDKVPPGTYRVVLRVNGQQAARSPEVNWVA